MNILRGFSVPLVVLSLLLCHGNAIVFDLTLNPKDSPMIYLPSFRFDDGGKYSVNITTTFGSNSIATQGGVDVLFCQGQLLTRIDPYDSYATPKPLCNDLFYLKDCLEVQALNPLNPSIHLNGTISNRDIYFLYVSNCLKLDLVRLEVQGSLKTSDGNHISYGSESFPLIFTCSAVFWFLIFLLFTGNAIKHFRKSIRIHRVINVSTLFHFAYAVLGAWVWFRIRQYGFVTTPNTVVDSNPNNYFISSFTASFTFPYLYWTLHSLKAVASTFIILLICKGYTITRHSLLLSEWIVIIGLTIMLTLTKFFGLLDLVSMGSIPYLLMLVVSLKYAFTDLAYNIDIMELQSQFVSRLCTIGDHVDTPVNKKRQTLLLFQTVLVLYTFLTSISSVVFLFFSDRKLWMPLLIEELLNVILYGFIYYLFHFRDIKFPDLHHFRFPIKPLPKMGSNNPLFIILQNPPTVRSKKTYPSFTLAPHEGFDIFALKEEELEEEEFNVDDDIVIEDEDSE